MQQSETKEAVNQQTRPTFDRLIKDTNLHAIQLEQLKETHTPPIAPIQQLVNELATEFGDKDDLFRFLDDMFYLWADHHDNTYVTEGYLPQMVNFYQYLHRILRVMEPSPGAYNQWEK